MQINQNCSVSFHYALLNAKGEVLETSREQAPITFTTGKNQIVPGLEKGMLGRAVGDKFQLKIKAEQGYGAWDEDKVFDIQASVFADMQAVDIGLMCEVTNPEGKKELVTVIEISEDAITVDANHAYAGHELKFSVEIMAIDKLDS